MVLAIGSDSAIANTTQTTILTHVASAGEFIRGFTVFGGAEAEIEIQVDATVQALGALISGVSPAGGNALLIDHQTITPIPLSAGENVTVKVTREESADSRNFRGELKNALGQSVDPRSISRKEGG